MAITSLKQKYFEVIKKLFPTGKAWDGVREKGTYNSKILDAYASEICRLDERGRKLIDEVDPRTTYELLPDWERVLGLPDECDPADFQTIQERRNRVIQILTTRGGQNEAFYKELASNFGFSVDVISAEDQPQFQVGLSRAGDRLTNGDWKYAFVIKAPAEFLVRFRTGRSSVGERLVTVGNDTLQCLMEKYKPAHTIVLFSFGDEAF